MKLAAPLLDHPRDPRISRDPRCPLTPAVVKKLVAQGLSVCVERSAGVGSAISDDAFAQAGAELWEAGTTWEHADVVLTVAPPSVEQVSRMKHGSLLVGLLSPTTRPDLMRTLRDRGVTAIAMEFIPRITRAQSMDALSSQANLAGYKAALLAADHLPKLMPMMMTAAGTLSPAKVFVLGVGVAGLQAIATAKRLGAVVEAFDVRTATREQVQSLGARFVELKLDTVAGGDASTSGGYAKELTPEQKAQQTELMARHMIAADAVIATAAVFGKPPPVLIPEHVVQQMSPGSVIVDMAASADHGHGNCAVTRPGETFTTDRGVTILGTLNLPALLPVHATQAYANNLDALLKELISPGKPAKDDPPATAAELKLNLDDEVQNGCVILHDGQVRNELVRQTLNAE